MNKKKLPYQVLMLVLLVSVGIFLLYRYISRKPDAGKFLERIREQNKHGFDSLQNDITYENNLHSRIKDNINQDDFKTASALIDTLFASGKIDIAHVYKGMIYAKQSKYLKAIEEYNVAIENDEFPLALGKRAEVYIKMNKLDMALKDYKKAYEWNFDYSFQIASTFELKNMKDSALKYYLIYSEHYPNNQVVLQKINSFKNN